MGGGGKPRKLPMVKRENAAQRATTFTKRRQGLFSKAAQLCLLCDAKVAVIVSSVSNNRKFYSLGYPSVNSVLNLAAPAEEEEEELITRTKKLGYSLLQSSRDDQLGGDFGLRWEGLSKELDDLVKSGGGDLKKRILDLLGETKKRAEAKWSSSNRKPPQIKESGSQMEQRAEAKWSSNQKPPQIKESGSQMEQQSEAGDDEEFSFGNLEEQQHQVEPEGMMLLDHDDYCSNKINDTPHVNPTASSSSSSPPPLSPLSPLSWLTEDASSPPLSPLSWLADAPIWSRFEDYHDDDQTFIFTGDLVEEMNYCYVPGF